MNTLFAHYSMTVLRQKLVARKISAMELAEECIRQYKQYEPRVNAWVCFDEEKLRAQARACDERLKTTGNAGLLEAMPVGVKDIMNTQDFPTQMGSPIWKDFNPGNDARIVFSLKQAGAVIPGKTVTAEFAVHTLGKTLNPHNPVHTPGTSSSGSAAAISMGMIPAALATQTAGSIVRPASFCGVYGFKPSFGLIPRTGMLKTTDSLDTVGFMAYHYEDLRTLFEVLRVHGPDYPVSHRYLSDKSCQGKPTKRPWKVAFVKTHTWKYVPDYAQKKMLAWVNKLSKVKGVSVDEVDLPPSMERAHEIHATIYDRTLAYYFSEEFKKAELVSPIMNRIIDHGNTIPVPVYQKALHQQEELCHDMEGFFQDYDVLVSHSTAGEAPLRETEESPDPALMWTLTHLPVIQAPVFNGPTDLPYGLQIAAGKYQDYRLLSFCDWASEQSTIPLRSKGLAE